MNRKVSDMPWECGKGWWQMIDKVAAAIDSFNAAHPESSIEASWHTCERCGATEGIITNLEGYRLTLCPDCRKEIKPRVTLTRRIVIKKKKNNE